jgi:hypothetical protein
MLGAGVVLGCAPAGVVGAAGAVPAPPFDCCMAFAMACMQLSETWS